MMGISVILSERCGFLGETAAGVGGDGQEGCREPSLAVGLRSATQHFLWQGSCQPAQPAICWQILCIFVHTQLSHRSESAPCTVCVTVFHARRSVRAPHTEKQQPLCVCCRGINLKRTTRTYPTRTLCQREWRGWRQGTSLVQYGSSKVLCRENQTTSWWEFFTFICISQIFTDSLITLFITDAYVENSSINLLSF